MGELLFSASYQKATEKLTLVISKAKDLHIEDELAVLGMLSLSDSIMVTTTAVQLKPCCRTLTGLMGTGIARFMQ